MTKLDKDMSAKQICLPSSTNGLWGSYVLDVGRYTGIAAVREQSTIPVFIRAFDTYRSSNTRARHGYTSSLRQMTKSFLRFIPKSKNLDIRKDRYPSLNGTKLVGCFRVWLSVHSTEILYDILTIHSSLHVMRRNPVRRSAALYGTFLSTNTGELRSWSGRV